MHSAKDVVELEERKDLLDWALCNLKHQATLLEIEQYECIGIPWRFFRWRRAHKKHLTINVLWAQILAGRMTKAEAEKELARIMEE